MAENRGKQFEQKFKEDISRIDEIAILRLPDQFNGWKNSSNISDFIVYKYPTLLLVELKCKYGNTFPLIDFVQYDRLLTQKGKKGVNPILILWFIDYDKVICFPIESLEKMKQDGLKSINIKTYENYPHIDIPSIKKRVFMDSDYTILFKELDKEY